MGARAFPKLAVTAAALIGITGCGGAGAPPAATSSGPVTFTYSPGFECCATSSNSISVQPNGEATNSVSGSPPVTVQLSSALTARIFSDVQHAWPLNALPATPGPPDSGGVTVAWDGQTSPNFEGASSGIESALLADSVSLSHAFNQ